MKKILYGTIAAILILPCALIFSEGETIIGNLIGIAYCCLLAALTKYTKGGRRLFLKIYKNI